MGAPPALNTAPPPLPADPLPPPRHPRWRSWVALLVLAPYPLLLGIVLPWTFKQPWFLQFTGWESAPSGSILPKTVGDLFVLAAENLLIFALFFLLACAFRGFNRGELFARAEGWWQPWAWGLLHSAALRILVAVAVMTVLGILVAAGHLTGHSPEALKEFRPNVEKLVEPGALRNPVYLLVATTLISFVVAGLREELWRAGVLRQLFDLLPDRGQSTQGRVTAVVLAAVVFGLGHWPQGPAGVVLTGTLGLGLGAILLCHRSLWVAVLAHGFFDATSFALLALVERMGLLDKLKGA
jgi:membrane protease YdiL (CAAX protease family)